MKKVNVLDIIVFLFMVLFIYAAATKLLEYELFKAQIGKSPLITKYSGVFAWFVPSIELTVAALLFLPRLRPMGLYASFSLMAAFTAYIAFILWFSPYVPCSCGGILSTMGWTEHLIFNVVFTILALWGIFLNARHQKNMDTRSPELICDGNPTP